MIEVPVLIVGAGPIGLTAAVLLKQQGVDALVIDQKSSFSDHPRARFMDSCTLELFRQMGIADAVEDVGIGPTWTKTVNCFTRLTEPPIAKVRSPEFHSVPRPITPQIPVMTSQDLLEPIIYERALDLGVDIRLRHTLNGLEQDGDGCTATIESTDTRTIRAAWVLGADGTRSRVREAMGCEMSGEVRDTFYRDVLFHADLSPWLHDQHNEGGLLWLAHSRGAGLYQPLDGKNRFRAQIAGLDPDEAFDDEYFKAWIRASVSDDADFPIEIFSKLVWRVGARTADRFRVGRLFLAGDAAHIFAPTGGMGMNTAFAGVRNLAWKLAYVVRGVAPETILDTYEAEWKPQAEWRTATALENHDYITNVYRTFFTGGDVDAALKPFEQYVDYPGVIFGYEVVSPLAASDAEHPPAVTSPVRQYVPVVRSGRRVPHIWLDAAENESILDTCGTDYVVMFSPDAPDTWQEAIAGCVERGFPLRTLHLTREQIADTPFANEAVVVVRPDLIVALHVKAGEDADANLLEKVLPV